jgi:hypothetical protein
MAKRVSSPATRGDGPCHGGRSSAVPVTVRERHRACHAMAADGKTMLICLSTIFRHALDTADAVDARIVSRLRCCTCTPPADPDRDPAGSMCCGERDCRCRSVASTRCRICILYHGRGAGSVRLHREPTTDAPLQGMVFWGDHRILRWAAKNWQMLNGLKYSHWTSSRVHTRTWSVLSVHVSIALDKP